MMKGKQTLKYAAMSVPVWVGLLLGACGGKQEAAAPSARYETTVVRRTSQQLYSRYSATLRGKQDVEIRPQVLGTITALCVEEGATVRQGQPICIIDQVPYQAALETAEANVEVAEANVATARMTAESKQNLFRKNIVSYIEKQTAANALQSCEAALVLAKAELKNAQNDFSYTIVRSPADGKVGMIPYKVGALVGPTIATPLTSVSDNSEIHAYFSLTEREMLNLSRQAGSAEKAIARMPEVELTLSDGSTYAHKGKIDAVSSMVDGSTGAVNLRATFPNKEHVIPSGGSGTLVFPYRMEGCIVIPQAATYEVQDKVYVYKVVDGKTVETLITVFPIDDGRNYIVSGGLEEGDVIVTEGAGTLQEGVEVGASAQVSTLKNAES